MRKASLLLAGFFTACWIISCGRQDAADKPDVVAKNDKNERTGVVQPFIPQVKPEDPKAPDKSPFVEEKVDDKQENFEAALAEAFKHLADGKQDDALLALQTAQTFQDSEFVRGEIEKLKMRIDQDAAAQKTVSNLESVLEQGNLEDAAQIGRDALKEFGGTDAAVKLVELRLQAEALQAAVKPEAPQARYVRFRAEGEAAIKDKNLRAAALALEQALQSKDDAQLQGQLDTIQASLQKYDRARERAAQLRRDPGRLEDAVTALQEAAEAWDTLQVRQELDEYGLALQRRRPRVGISDFEVRGNIGIPDAGRTIAEELLPSLKPRYDLVEREQIGKVVEELKLENDIAGDAGGQMELGELAKVQYLVLGSVSRAAGITVQARLVDVRSGLIVQTAKVSAPTVDDLMPLLANLGKQLLMTDEEKMAFEQEVVQAAQKPAPVAAEVQLPPPPQAPVVNVPPPAQVVPFSPVPPDARGLQLQDFNRLPPPPAAGQVLLQPAPGGAAELRIKNRLLNIAVELGDNQFRRGDAAGAHHHFNFALNLAPDNVDLRFRLANAPAPVLVPPRFYKPRIAVLNFAVIGNPLVVPPTLGMWTPQQLAPYMLSEYDVVDPNEVYWYMARMGLSLRDLLEDPYARRWLGRALNVRYFLMGNLVQTASFDVHTYLIDAEYGFLQGFANMHVQNVQELRLRIPELAQLTLMDPGERARYQADMQRFQALIAQGEQSMIRRLFGDAVGAFEAALRIRPANPQAQFLLTQARTRHQQFLWEEARRQQYLREQALAAEAARRRWEIAQAAEAARRRPGGVVIAVNLRSQAHDQLVTQARVALKIGNFGLSISNFQSAIALAPSDDLYRELALARSQQTRNAELAAAQVRAAQEAALRQKREQELAAARKQIELEKLRTQALLAAQHKAQADRDRAGYQKSFDDGQRLMAKGQYDAAIASLQSARRFQKTEAVELLLNQAMIEQARSSAEKKGAKEKAELERQLTLERDRRIEAEATAKANERLYEAALVLAAKAMAAKDYEVAQAKYEEAGKIRRTDIVLTGLRQSGDFLRQSKAKAIAAQDRDANLKKAITLGQSNLQTGKHDAAIQAFAQAKKLDPDNVEVLAGLTKAEQLRDKALAQARKQNEETDRQKNFQRQLKSGQENLTKKNYDAAVVALGEAVKLDPTSEPAKTALKTAETARGADAKATAELQKKTLVYRKHLSDGQTALAGKRFDDAIAAFSAAQKVLPGDKTSADYLEDAQDAKKAQTAAIATEAKKKAAELARAGEVKKALQLGQTALAGKKFDDAAKAIARAAELAPDDPAVVRAQTDLQVARKTAAAETTAAAEAKAFAAKAQERADMLKKHLTAASVAIKSKNFVAAENALGEARKLAPTDPAVVDAQRDLTAARDASLQTDKTQAAYQQAIAAGQKALIAKDYDDAVKDFSTALKVMPKDPQATKLLAQAQQAWDLAKKTASVDIKNKENQAEYQRLVKQGNVDLQAKRFADAKKSFAEALKLAPNDATALRGYQTANQELEPPKTKEQPKGKPMPDVKVLFQKELQEAQTLEKQGKWTQAIQNYRDALKLIPDEPKATQGLKNSQFNLHLSDGQKDLNAGRYKEAVRAFEAALEIAPNNAVAQKLLAKAKQGKK